VVGAKGETESCGEIFGYNEITRQYYDRYRLPVMHTETNTCEGPKGNEAAYWLRKEWANVLRVRNSGVPIVGFTWYSLTDQVDWEHRAAREAWTCESSGSLRPRPKAASSWEGLQAVNRELARGLAGAERVPHWSLGAASARLSLPNAQYQGGAVGTCLILQPGSCSRGD
jgi:hypothetical protein